MTSVCLARAVEEPVLTVSLKEKLEEERNSSPDKVA